MTIPTCRHSQPARAKKKQADRLRAELARREAGKPTRDEWLASNGTSRGEPWTAQGVSRATWYRRRKAADQHPKSSTPTTNLTMGA